MDNWFYNVFINVPEERSGIKHQCIWRSILSNRPLVLVLYFKSCGYVFSILVVDITYLINLLGLLIPSPIWFIFKLFFYLFSNSHAQRDITSIIFIASHILWDYVMNVQCQKYVLAGISQRTAFIAIPKKSYLLS